MLNTLRSVIQEVNEARDLKSALDVIVERVRAALGADVCSVYLLDEKTDRFVFMATRGLNEEQVGKLSLARDEGLIGYVSERAEPINLEDAQRHPRHRHFEEIGEAPYHAFLGLPIIHHRKVLGVLAVQQVETRRFGEEEEAFLLTLGAQLAGVIAHANASGSLHLGDGEEPAARPTLMFRGVQGGPGVAIGTAIVSFPEAVLDEVPDKRAGDTKAEIRLFRQAIAATRKEIAAIAEQLSDRLNREELALFEAYLHMLDDSALSGEVVARIKAGDWAQGALKKVVQEHVRNFVSMQDPYLSERAADVRELGNRVLAKLQSVDTRQVEYAEGTILVSQELTPTDLALVPRAKLAGLVSVQGSGKSHVAILAEAMGIPTVMGVEDLPTELLDGKPMIVDGYEGVVITYPREEDLAYYKGVLEEEAALEKGFGPGDEPCITQDGKRVRLWVNTGLMSDVARSLDRGAEGVGLYRTEIYFMMNDRFPTEEEQKDIYRGHLQAFAPRPVTMRTLDIGGDKALSYFPIEEANPFLGWRGIRVTLDHPEIFLSQVRAMIRASEGIETYLRIMLPMVSSVAEIDEARRLIDQCHREVLEEGVAVKMPDVGVMIEVPAAVYQARDIIKRVDFLSVGSNDLIQYMLAVDRNNAQVAGLYQEFHPAVLAALAHVVEAAHGEGKPLGICGEMAGNPPAAVLLMAMGYDVLSMNATSLQVVKYALSNFKMAKARRMLKKALGMDDAERIKRYVDDEMRRAGLGQLVRSKRYG